MPITALFIMDPIASINPNKDTSLAIMLAAQKRGWEIHYSLANDLWLIKNTVWGKITKLTVKDDPVNYYNLQQSKNTPLNEFNYIFIRKDPPFDMNYIYLTYLLEHTQQQGTSVINNPRSIRDCNEKLFTSWFPQCCPQMLVTAEKNKLIEFSQQHEKTILKPLDSMGGHSIFCVTEKDKNLNVIIETLTQGEKQLVMAQQFIPEIKQGDKRVLMIKGEPIEYALARIPAKNDFRGNLAAGATYEGRELSENDRWIAAQVGPTLREKGLVFVGLDIIGNYLTEINVTSPTCVRELDRLYSISIADKLLDTLVSQS